METQVFWRLRMFGGLRADNGQIAVAHFCTQKTALLCAILATPPNRPHGREELIEMIWPDSDILSGRASLSQALSWLRRQLEPAKSQQGTFILSDRRFVQINPATVSTDIGDFQEALALAKKSISESDKIDALQKAVGFYKGDFLPSFYDDWSAAERRRLENDYLSALFELAGYAEKRENLDDGIEILKTYLRADPLNQDACFALMRLLAKSGQYGAALRQFDEMKRILQEQLNAQSPLEAAQFADQLRRKSPSSRLPSRSGFFPRIPEPLTKFFGRDSEIAQIGELTKRGRPRLITIAGIGGTGKTRLALAAASKLSPLFDGCVLVVSLTDVSGPDTILQTALASLGQSVDFDAPLMRQIEDLLGNQKTLMVLDNLEHLLPKASRIVGDLLESIPALTILATSRIKLGIPGECELNLTPLPRPSPNGALDEIRMSPSVRLFEDRAMLADPGFAVDKQNSAQIARLCERLEGIPLSIELCAAWAKSLTPEQMLEKLSNRFDLLVNRDQNASPRHGSVRAAIEYSYFQLDDKAKTLFCRLSVFRDGWPMEAAERVGKDLAPENPVFALECITQLSERSLISVEETNGRARYRMLETLRDFLTGLMSDQELRKANDLHLAFCLELSEEARSVLAGSHQDRQIKLLESETENIRAALEWALASGQFEAGIEISANLQEYWKTSGGYVRNIKTLEKMLNAPEGASQAMLARGWTAYGYFQWLKGEILLALDAHQKALNIWKNSAI